MIKIPLSFLRDEVRNGFYISTQIKQAWAAQLQILSVIDEICIKNDIKYFAEWGSLLATIRHGGYIPWDDDVDICMIREDYNKFREVAKKEMPEGFCIQDYSSQQDHWNYVAKVLNRNGICFEEEHLSKYNNFPYIACVDIFVQDYIHKDEQEEKKRDEAILRLTAIADGIVNNQLRPESKEIFIREIENKYHCSLMRKSNYEIGVVIYQIVENIMSEVPRSKARGIAQIFPDVLKGFRGYKKEYYNKAVRLPYEFISIPVPYCYHELAEIKYGNYMIPIKGSAAHNYPFFEGQRENLQRVADFKLPEFTFDKSMIVEKEKSTLSIKTIASECLEQMGIMMESVNENAVDILPELQQLAIDLGNLIEQNKGENCSVIEYLEKYCEDVFLTYNAVIDGDESAKLIENMWKSFSKITESVDKHVINRTNILFLATGAERWDDLREEYEQYQNDEEVDLYVVALPIYRKSPVGELLEECIYDIEKYPKEISVIPFDYFNIQMVHPDVIYIQDIFDGENPILSVPKEYYSGVLQNNSEKIVYITPKDIHDFNKDDVCEIYNLRKMICTPGFVNADEIIVRSKILKERFVEIAVEFAGYDTYEYWNNKIKIKSCDKTNKKNVRNLLYCIGANEITENGNTEKFISIIEERLQMMKRGADNGLEIIVRLYPNDMQIWKEICKDAYDTVIRKIESICQNEGCKFDNESSEQQLIEKCDAYYGAPSSMVFGFTERKKPVLIGEK